MLKSVKDDRIRQNTIDDIAYHYSDSDATTYFADMERVSRLRSDAIATPLYVVALLESIHDAKEKMDVAQRLFAARSQFPISQYQIASNLLQHLGQDIELLNAFCDMTRGSINVERYYVEAEVYRMQLIDLESAAQAAERLASETAMQVPYDKRLYYVSKYLEIITRINDNVRTLLGAYKFRNEAFTSFINDKETTAEYIHVAHFERSRICSILQNALLREGRFKDACTYFEYSIESFEFLKDVSGLSAALELALVSSFVCGESMRFLGSNYFDAACHLDKRPVYEQIRWSILRLASIIRSTCIDKYDELRAVDFSFIQYPNLVAQIPSGFVKLQFDKIYHLYERITLQRISYLIGIENMEIEKILIYQAYDIRIDRITGEVLIKQRSGDDKYLEMSRSVYDILQGVAECSYLLGAMSEFP